MFQLVRETRQLKLLSNHFVIIDTATLTTAIKRGSVKSNLVLTINFNATLIDIIGTNVASRVLTKFTGQIKEKIGLYPLIDLLAEERMISEAEKTEVTDQHNGWSKNQRMDKLLDFVKKSVADEEDFDLFTSIIKQENTRRADKLVKEMLEVYNTLSA